MADRENISRNQSSTAMLLSNLEMIKNNLERTDAETRMRHENQITDLTRKLVQAQSKLDSNSEMKKLEEQLKMSVEKEIAIKEQYEANKTKLENVEKNFETLKLEYEEYQKQNKLPLTSPTGRGRARGILRLGAGASPTGVVRDLQLQLAEEKAKITNVNKSYEESKKHCDQLKLLNDQYEKQLKSSTEANKTIEFKLNQREEQVEELETEIMNIKDQMIENQKNNLTEQEELKVQVSKIQTDLACAKSELEEMRCKYDEANAAQIKAKREAADSASLEASVQDKYEREVMLHAADLKALAALKEKLATHSTEYEAINSAKSKAEEALRDTRLGFEERETLLRQEAKNLTSRVHELEDQNKSLLDQFTQLSDKMATIQNKLTEPGSEKLNVSFTEDEARSSDQLREVIKYLRRERDVAIGKCEVAQSEANRYQTQKNSLESQVQQLNATLAEEREKAQVSLDTAGKYGELHRKVQTMDALADSNRVLREEKDKLQTVLSEKTAQLTSIENQIGPLQKQIREVANKNENILMDKKTLESEKEMYKRRTQELVEKLNKAKPEDLLRLRQELVSHKKTFSIKENELKLAQTQVSKLQNSVQGYIAEKTQMKQTINTLQGQVRNSMEETKKATEISQKFSSEKSRLSQQIADSKAKELSLQKELENVRKANVVKDGEIKKLSEEYEEENIKKEKNLAQIRKIAKKYKTAADSAEEINKKYENEITAMKQKCESASNIPELQSQIQKLKLEVLSKETEIKKLKSSNIGGSSSDSNDQDLDNAKVSLLSSTLEKTSKKLEDSETKSQLFENRMVELEKEKELMNKKLQMQQRLIENLQKQGSGILKPSTSGVTSDKVSIEPPPTANIKPMAAPAATVSSPRSQAATQVVAPSRTIPTASIRPLAPTASGQGQSGQGSSVVLVSPLESHSEGMVSSTVTLPQATVTPTPATPTPTQPTPCTTTLTATVSPTPATLSSPAVTAFPHQSSVQIPTSQPLSTSASGSSSGSSLLPSQAVGMPQLSTSAQVASVSPSTSFSSSQSSAAVATVAPHQDQQQKEQAMESSSSADALVSQAIAMVTPRVDQSHPSMDDASDGNQPSGSHKRKLDTQEAEEEEFKRKRIQTSDQEEAVGPSSSHEDTNRRSGNKNTTQDDVIFVESNEEDSDVDENMEDKEAEVRGKQQSQRHHQGSEAEANAGDEMEAEAQSQNSENIQETPSESSQLVSQSQQPQPSSGSGHASSTQSNVASSIPLRSGLRSPLRRPQDRHQSAAHQNLPTFGHLQQYHEDGGDDSIVPSTPTLFAPRREGFSAEATSSPQVPSGGFLFSGSSGDPPNTSGLAQMAEGGMIDDTRVDLGQMENSASRTLPSSVSIRPSSVYSSSEGGVSTSGSPGTSGQRTLGEGSSSSTTASISPRPGLDDGKFTEADSVASEVGRDDPDTEEG